MRLYFLYNKRSFSQRTQRGLFLLTGYSFSFSACISQRSSAVNIVFTAKGAEIFRRVCKAITFKYSSLILLLCVYILAFLCG